MIDEWPLIFQLKKKLEMALWSSRLPRMTLMGGSGGLQTKRPSFDIPNIPTAFDLICRGSSSPNKFVRKRAVYKRFVLVKNHNNTRV